MSLILPFLDRTEAGKALAKKLSPFRSRKDTYVIALLRGGIAVGRELAAALDLPLIPWSVRKIGHPENPEYALGAISQGGGTFLDDQVMQEEAISFAEIEPVIEEELQELQRRRREFASNIPPLKGAWVVLTDDGAATGATLLAAIEDMRTLKVARITVALPVCAPGTAERLAETADEMVAVAFPSPFGSVGQWYLSFPQLSDADVRGLLKPPPRRTLSRNRARTGKGKNI